MMEPVEDLMVWVVILLGIGMCWYVLYQLSLKRKKIVRRLELDEHVMEDFTMVETTGAKIVAGIAATIGTGILGTVFMIFIRLLEVAQ